MTSVGVQKNRLEVSDWPSTRAWRSAAGAPWLGWPCRIEWRADREAVAQAWIEQLLMYAGDPLRRPDFTDRMRALLCIVL